LSYVCILICHFRLRNAELTAAAQRKDSGGAGKDSGAEREKKEYQAAAAAELSRLAAAASAAQLAEQSAKTSAANLSSELAEKKSENEALLSEMGNMVGAVEELQKQNERLVTALAQRDDTHQALVAVSIFALSFCVLFSCCSKKRRRDKWRRCYARKRISW
jgi:hypothetical protein